MLNSKKETIGVNIFGNSCKEKVLVLNKETAIQQYHEMMQDMIANGDNVEYTVDASCFSPTEAEQFYKMAECIMIFYATMKNCDFNEYVRK